MPVSHARFGTDLRLLRELDRQKSSRDPGHDLSVARRPETGQLDLETLAGADNLAQALLLRFLTPAGALAPLGHPDYGSRLAELIGELNNETNRNRAKLYVLQALALEPRVRQVLSVSVTQDRRRPTVMDIAVSLLAVDSDTPLNLVFPFFLEGGVTP
ncbi:MAG TPA: GPW/gp25 family protein [Pyrinomonadaceae bacterium]|nr:GPW/gp25 family protein [Pyrinomonadaceae bacterium]